MPRGMVRACSLSLILFPQASALYKIGRDIVYYAKFIDLCSTVLNCSLQKVYACLRLWLGPHER
ncbi:hypothetical protein BU073_01930 [Mammaliicoccus vitulinus]|nr:hypothetical protein BU073_01930 [Mammaliicoccus vitulinus]